MKLIITDSIARAAATDAGNRAMRAGGRSAWSKKDYAACILEFNRLSKHVQTVK